MGPVQMRTASASADAANPLGVGPRLRQEFVVLAVGLAANHWFSASPADRYRSAIFFRSLFIRSKTACWLPAGRLSRVIRKSTTSMPSRSRIDSGSLARRIVSLRTVSDRLSSGPVSSSGDLLRILDAQQVAQFDLTDSGRQD